MGPSRRRSSRGALGEPAPELPPFSFGAAFSVGWQSLKRNYGLLLAAVAIYAGVTIAVAFVQGATEAAVGIEGLLSLPLALLFTAQFTTGLVYIGVQAARGQPLRVDSLLRGFSTWGVYWTIAGIQGLLLLIMLALLIPTGLVLLIGAWAAGGYDAAIVLAVMLMVAAALAMMYIGIRLAYAMVIVVDEEIVPRPGVIESMSMSWRITGEGRWLPLLVLAIVLSLLFVVTMVACLLPALFFGGPLVLATWGAAYAMLANQHLPSASRARCRRGGYDLSGAPGALQCPECGMPGV
jgi:hypothetical protein